MKAYPKNWILKNIFASWDPKIKFVSIITIDYVYTSGDQHSQQISAWYNVWKCKNQKQILFPMLFLWGIMDTLPPFLNPPEFEKWTFDSFYGTFHYSRASKFSNRKSLRRREVG